MPTSTLAGSTSDLFKSVSDLPCPLQSEHASPAILSDLISATGCRAVAAIFSSMVNSCICHTTRSVKHA